MTENFNFKFYLILTSLNLNSHVCLVAINLDSIDLESRKDLRTIAKFKDQVCR